MKKKHHCLKTRRKPLSERYPNGHVKPERPAVTVAQYRREVMAASVSGADPLLGTQLGWLARQRKITQDQLEAGLLFAEICGAYDLAMGRRRTAASPAYEIGHSASTGDTTEKDIWAIDSYDAMMAALPTGGVVFGEGKLFGRRKDVPLLEALCLDDLAVDGVELTRICGALDVLAAHFGGRSHVHVKAPSKKTTQPTSIRRGEIKAAVHPLDAALDVLAPKLDPMIRSDLRRELQARIDRAKFVAHKEARDTGSG